MHEGSSLTPSSLPADGDVAQRAGDRPAAGERLTNWAGNLEYGARCVHYPSSLEEVQEVVAGSPVVRALGTRHSFNGIAVTGGALVSLRQMDRVVSLDRAAMRVTVEAGITYAQLAGYLHANGCALHNLPSTPHISVAGACATATHGSGAANKILATAVSSFALVCATGEVVTLSRERDGDLFHGAVVGLGALGIVTRLTLDVEPAFQVSQLVYRDLPMRELERNFDTIMSGAYSVSLFTDWTRKNIGQVWIKRRLHGDGPAAIAADFHGARPATRDLHPVEGEPVETTTPQMGIAGPWHERLPHFKAGHNPSVGRELQSEYFVPAEHAFPAIMAVEALHERIAPHLFISEIRTVAADELWMSPCRRGPCMAVHFTWKPEWDRVAPVLAEVEAKLAPFGAVPHWGKLFTMVPAVLRSRYARLADFRDLLARYDPGGKFRNGFLNQIITGR